MDAASKYRKKKKLGDLRRPNAAQLENVAGRRENTRLQRGTAVFSMRAGGRRVPPPSKPTTRGSSHLSPNPGIKPSQNEEGSKPMTHDTRLRDKHLSKPKRKKAEKTGEAKTKGRKL